MGRAKIAMEFITKEKARNTTYLKRKKGLIKKAHEFSVLCDVPICIIIYPYNEGKVPLNPEVCSFKPRKCSEGQSSNVNFLDLARAWDPAVAREIIDRYFDVSKEEKKKRAINLCDMFDERNRRAGQELSKQRHRNARLKYPTNCDSTILSGFNADQLVGLIAHLDQKIELLRERVAMINGNQGASVPIFDSSPVSGFVIPSNYNITHHVDPHQMGNIDVKPSDRFSSLNYPTSNHQACRRLGLFDPNGFHHQLTAPAIDNGELGHGNLAVDPICYNNQGSESLDIMVASSSSIVAGLPMSMPLELALLSNVSVSWHGMFHK